MENERVNHYAVIPMEILHNTKITANAKILYGDISALCSTEGFCWATNNYFAKLYEVSQKTIQNWLCNLKNNGVIRIEYSSASGGKDKTIRRIYIVSSGGNIIRTPPKKSSHGVRKKDGMGCEKKFAQNNTSNSTNNITSNNHNEPMNESLITEQRGNIYRPSLEEFANYCIEKSLHFDYEAFYSSNESKYHWSKPWQESIAMWCTKPHSMPEYHIIQDLYKFIYNRNSKSPWLDKHENYSYLKKQLLEERRGQINGTC